LKFSVAAACQSPIHPPVGRWPLKLDIRPEL
jgi:hypothetical protein